MDGLTGGVWTLALGIISLALLYAFKGPKEMSNETNRRIGSLEEAHHELDRAVAGLTVEVRHLAGNVGTLAQALRESDLRRVSGRQPRA